MLSSELLERMRCMHTGSQLAQADAELVAELNAAIWAGVLRDPEGRAVDRKVDEGLVNADRSYFYPIVDNVLQMMSDECIDLGTIDQTS